MLILNSLSSLQEFYQKQDNNIVLTIGNFDGVHIGHQFLIKKLKDIAKKYNAKVLIITFDPLANEIFNPKFKKLLSLEDKIYLLSQQQIDYLLVLNFTQQLMQLKAIDFINSIYNKKLKHIHIGDDFTFGNNKEGNFKFLDKIKNNYGFNVSNNKSITRDNERISSTMIRNFLSIGNFLISKRLLGYEYFISGTVKQGKKLARKLGFPTANIHIYHNSVLNGVYFTKVQIDNEFYFAVSNIGYNPTVESNLAYLKCETYIFDFSQDIYNNKIKIIFLEKIRDEKKFNSINELKIAIENDVDISLKLIKKYI